MLVAHWPLDAPRGAVAAFLREYDVSRSWFDKIRKRARVDGDLSSVAEHSKGPQTSPAKTTEFIEQLALTIRAKQKKEGWDYGPLTVKWELEAQGFIAPSRATLARIFTRNGVVTPQPKKRPRSSWKRFCYARPNDLWQMDATEWVLATGLKAVIFQLTDDHSRLAVASLAARSENAHDAIQVTLTGIARHGVPVRLLTDNGVAFNPSRRGWVGALVTVAKNHGITPISSSVNHPQTQGKNERGHSTLKQWLRAHPRARSLKELQKQLDTYDEHYNTRRPHQSLDGATPYARYTATVKAPEPLRPEPDKALNDTKSVIRTVRADAILNVAYIRIQMGKENIGETFHVLYDTTTIRVFTARGLLIQEHPRPPRGTYIPNGKPRGFLAKPPTMT